jgi:DNA-binding LacI/PurR family transcriptional regulator
MATIYDVAKRASVSTYTVSSVLNGSAKVSAELTRRVLQAVEDLNYIINDVARSLHTRKTRTVAMLIPDIGSPFYAKVVRGVEEALRAAGYSLLVGNTYNQAQEQLQYLSVFRAKQVDGFLLFPAPGGFGDVERIMRQGVPVIFVGRLPDGLDADSVTADNAAGARLATEHLIRRRHRRIGLITGHFSVSAGADRVRGWREALRAARLPAPKTLAAEGDWTAESGYRLMQRFLALRDPPTAIFAGNFLMMTGALRAIQERGLHVPRDVEVMSADDSEWLDVFEPRISTVAQPSYQMGFEAAQLLLRRLQNPGAECQRIVLAPELHIR